MASLSSPPPLTRRSKDLPITRLRNSTLENVSVVIIIRREPICPVEVDVHHLVGGEDVDAHLVSELLCQSVRLPSRVARDEMDGLPPCWGDGAEPTRSFPRAPEARTPPTPPRPVRWCIHLGFRFRSGLGQVLEASIDPIREWQGTRQRCRQGIYRRALVQRSPSSGLRVQKPLRRNSHCAELPTRRGRCPSNRLIAAWQ